MPTLKTVVLTLENKEKIVIPVSSSNGKEFKFSGLDSKNDVETIRLEYDKKADANYKVVNAKYVLRRKEVSKRDFGGYIHKLDRKKTRN